MIPPPEDSFLVHCKGFCGKFIAIPISKLKHYVGNGFLTDFANSFVCKECYTAFVVAIEQVDKNHALLTGSVP